MLNYAIIGFGGLGKSHFNNTAEIEKRTNAKLVAICDIEESAFHTKTSTNLGEDKSILDLSAYKLYTNAEEMLNTEKLDFVLTALPTYIHEQIAVLAMKKGIHVFSEKPMAISYEQGKHMLDVSKEMNVKLMIGQCVRYFPEYKMLKEMIDTKKYGKLVEAEFYRLGSTPKWSWQNWFCDETKSGGAILDLHVHDVDFINYCLGKPNAVCSVATNHEVKHESVTTLFYYDDVAVTAKGSWGFAGDFGFRAYFRARFENASVECKDGKFMLYVEGEEMKELPIPSENGYVEEVVDFIGMINENRESSVNPPESSLQTIEIALAEKKSVDLKQIITL